MDINEQAWNVRKHYDRKANIEGLVIFSIFIVVMFYMFYRIMNNLESVTDGYFWEYFGFHEDFYFGFVSGVLYIAIFVVLEIFINNKKKWKNVLIMDNTNNDKKVTEIENNLLKTKTRVERILLNPEVHKYKDLIQYALKGHHWILVVNDGRPLTEQNKKYIQYANKKKNLIKWYGKSDFKFNKTKVTKFDYIWGWYIVFIMISIPSIVIQTLYVYMGYSYDPTLLQQIILFVWAFGMPLLFMKPAIKWYRRKTRRFDRRYINYKELKRMESE